MKNLFLEHMLGQFMEEVDFSIDFEVLKLKV